MYLGTSELTAGTALPHHLGANHLSLRGQPHLLDDAAQQLLLRLHVERPAIPPFFEVAEHLTHLLGRTDWRCVPLPTPVLRPRTFSFSQAFVPRSLQRLRHQPVGGINQLVPSLRKFTLPFQRR